MPPTPIAQHSHWDIFCNVIDNFGDIGVCWRLARQLAAEHGIKVRLWVDELHAFQHICPDIDTEKPVQNVHEVEVRRWTGDFSGVIPGDVVIEAFACHLPDLFEEAMASRHPKPAWISLDYLSAEDWVAGCHALPSPHSRLPLAKHFFFPGFTHSTGGLLRENDLMERRQHYETSTSAQQKFWQTLGFVPPPPETLLISLFSYENPAIPDLLDAWANGSMPVCCLAPLTHNHGAIESFFGQTLLTGKTIHRGQLELRTIPFVEQTDYDKLLWACNINLVRGEDSFVRAQWAAKPMLWQIYPQEESAHLIKLRAFLDLYSDGMTDTTAQAVRKLFLAWNGDESEGEITRESWERYLTQLPALEKNAINWEKELSKQQDLCSQLVQFCASKL